MYLRQKHLLALGISEYQTAIDHLYALRTAGVAVPANTISGLQVEQHRLMYRWRLATGEVRWDPGLAASVLREVRTWVTTHISEVDALLRSER